MRKFLAIGLTLIAAACAGTAARQEVLLPAMAQAWKGVRADIESGIPTLSDATAVEFTERELASFQEVFDTGDRVGLLTINWPWLRGVAQAGISARVAKGEIGPGVANSKIERLLQFDMALIKIVEDL